MAASLAEAQAENSEWSIFHQKEMQACASPDLIAARYASIHSHQASGIAQAKLDALKGQ